MDPHPPDADTDTIADPAALIAFYGGQDHVVPPFVGPPYECDNMPDCSGPARMFQLRRENGYCSQLYTDPDALHRFVWLDPDLPPGEDQSKNRLARTQFIVSRACCFFKSVICGTPCSYDQPMVMHEIEDWASAYYDLFGTGNGEPVGCNNDGSMRYRSIGDGSGTIYPNPSNGRVHIVGAGFDNGGDYTLFDYLGRTIAEGTIKRDDSPIDLRQYPDGLYFIRLSDNTHEYTARVILQRWTD
jgi:hypothetical protein